MSCQGCINRQRKLIKFLCKKADSFACKKAQERLERMLAPPTEKKTWK